MITDKLIGKKEKHLTERGPDCFSGFFPAAATRFTTVGDAGLTVGKVEG
jgi:hypothetical protein